MNSKLPAYNVFAGYCICGNHYDKHLPDRYRNLLCPSLLKRGIYKSFEAAHAKKVIQPKSENDEAGASEPFPSDYDF